MQYSNSLARHNELVKKVCDELITIGYPKESIAVEYAVSSYELSERIDIAIVDFSSMAVLCVFEVKITKTSFDRNRFSSIEGQLSRYAAKLGISPSYAYLVVGKDDGSFELFSFDIDEETGCSQFPVPIDIDSLPAYGSLVSTSRLQGLNAKKEEIKKTIDWFKIVCWVCSGAALALLLLDFFSVLVLSVSQLAFFGIFVALLIMPFAQKLKILGIEFERFSITPKKD